MNNLTLEIGDVLITTNQNTVRIASKSNPAKKFISLEQANELLVNNQIALVAIDINGDEVFVTPAAAIEHRAHTKRGHKNGNDCIKFYWKRFMGKTCF